MSIETKLVDYEEPLSFTVGRFLLRRGFNLASKFPVAQGALFEDDSIGVLYKDPKARPRTYLFGLVKRAPSRMFLGTIYFREKRYGSSISSIKGRDATKQNWVFEIHGSEYVELLMQLTEEMASNFNIKITLRLVSDWPILEADR